LSYVKDEKVFAMLDCHLKIHTNPKGGLVIIKLDEGNTHHLQLGHGIEPDEAEEVFANEPFFRLARGTGMKI
jgi:hypothetical protein